MMYNPTDSENDSDEILDEDEKRRLFEERAEIQRQLDELAAEEKAAKEAKRLTASSSASPSPVVRKGPHTPPGPPPESEDEDYEFQSADVTETSQYSDVYFKNSIKCETNSIDAYTDFRTNGECQSSMDFNDDEDEDFARLYERNRSSSVSQNGDEDEEVFEKPPIGKECPFTNKENKVWKTVMEKFDKGKFSQLPEGWKLIVHVTGIPMYYHKPTQVLTLSKPYTTDQPVFMHSIPLTSLPCLYRKKMIEREEAKKEEEEYNTESETRKKIEEEKHIPGSTVAKLGNEILSSAQAGIQDRTRREVLVENDEFHGYCSKLFSFKQILVRKYANAEEKYQARKERRTDSMLYRAGVKKKYNEYRSEMNEKDMLIVGSTGGVLIDVTPVDHRKRIGRRPYLMNPVGRSTVSVLNEFMQRLVKGKLEYEYEDNRNVSCPYKSTVWLTLGIDSILSISGSVREKLQVLKEKNDLDGTTAEKDNKKFPIGRGVGHSKKVARLASAKEALLKILPNLKISEDFNVEGAKTDNTMVENSKGYDEEAMELFDKLKLDSKNVVPLCTQFGMIKPYSLLKEAVSRSIRWNGMNLDTVKAFVGSGTQVSKIVLTLGDMKVEAEANGVKVAMQIAAQEMLGKMHPELDSYGSFLRLYGGFEDKALIENAKKQHEAVVRLQGKTGNLLLPNQAVISKLQEEMLKIEKIVPARQFLYGLAPKPDDNTIVSGKSDVATQTILYQETNETESEDPRMVFQFTPSFIEPIQTHVNWMATDEISKPAKKRPRLENVQDGF